MYKECIISFYLLCLCHHSWLMCVYEEDSLSSVCSSIVIASKTKMEKDGKLSLIVDLQTKFDTDCVKSEPQVYAVMGGSNLERTLLDNSTVQIQVLGSHQEGEYIISLSYYNEDQCGHASISITHQITLHIVGDPHISLVNDKPTIIHCLSNANLPTMWIQFEKDGKILGYRGPFSSPIIHNSYTKIYYNQNKSICILEMNKRTKKDLGIYLCSTILPYPTEYNVLTTNSTPIRISLEEHKDSNDLIITVTVVGGTFLVIVIVVIIVIVYCYCKRNRREIPRGRLDNLAYGAAGGE